MLKGIWIAIVVLLVGACGHEAAQEEGEASTEQVTVIDFHYSQLPGGARILTGKLYNPTDELIRNAQIQVSLYDQDNRRVATMSIAVQDVSPGEQKAFREAVRVEEDVFGARVRSVLVL